MTFGATTRHSPGRQERGTVMLGGGGRRSLELQSMVTVGMSNLEDRVEKST